MKITCLIENEPSQQDSNLFYEHGLSLHISFKGHLLLFDMGQSDRYYDNALKLGIDLSKIETAILSHHHYDHGGGLGRFLQMNKNAMVYLKPQPAGEYYSYGFGKKFKYIGLDKALLTQEQKRLVFINNQTEIYPDIFIITNIDSEFPKPKGNRYLYLNRDGKFEPDLFDHELILVFKDDDGLIIFTGCAHNGIINMVKTVKTAFPMHTIKALIGGFHLVNSPIFNSMLESKKSLNQIAHVLAEYDVQKIYTGHCTGKKAFQFLKKNMNDTLHKLVTGDVIRI